MKKKIIFILVLSLLMSIIAGCNSSDVVSEPEIETVVSEPPASIETEAASEPSKGAELMPGDTEPQPEEDEVQEETIIQYPIDTFETLSFCTKYSANDCSNLAPSTEESAVWIAAAEATGVHISVVDINAWTYDEQIALMLASDDMTDMMLGFVGYYPTGVDAAIEDNMIINIADYLELCPDYSKLIARDEYRNEVTTDNGAIGAFYGLDESDPSVSFGMYIRSDYLNKVGLDNPVTVDDMETVLSAFKTELGLQYPIYLGSNNISACLTGAWDVPKLSGLNLVQINGEVTAAPFMSSFDDAISTLADWYSKGLISSDFVGIDGSFVFLPAPYTAAVTGGTTGVFLGGTTTIDSLYDNGISNDPNWSVAAIPTPVMEKGQIIHAGEDPLSKLSGDHVSISASCENIELAVMWCNYFFTPEGSLLASYGIEGESFTYNDNNEPWLMEYAYTGDDQYTKGQKYMNWLSIPFGLYMPERSAASYSDYYFMAKDTWNSNLDHSYMLSSSYSMTADEAELYNAIALNIETYMEESILKFITNEMPLSELDTFRETMINIGYNDMIAIVQTAYDRYLARD